MEDLCPHAERFSKGCGADRHDHELLNIDIVVGMSAAVDDIHHRQRKFFGVAAADILIERQAGLFGSGLGNSQGNPEDGVCAKLAFVFGAVEIQHLSGQCRSGR